MDTQRLTLVSKRKRNFSKSTRLRLKKRRELLQREFDHEGLSLIATYRDTIQSPPLPCFKIKKQGKPKVVSIVSLKDGFERKDLGDKILVRPRVSVQAQAPPPVICLVTPPHSSETNDDPIIVRHIELTQEQRVRARRAKVSFHPVRRIVAEVDSNQRPILMSRGCKIRPRNEFCRNCFEEKYYLTWKPTLKPTPEPHKNNKLREELRNLYGESDISD